MSCASWVNILQGVKFASQSDRKKTALFAINVGINDLIKEIRDDGSGGI